MNKILTISLFFLTILTYGQSKTYIITSDSLIKIGNGYIERTISISNNHPVTIEIFNKLSNKRYKIEPNSNEFSLEIVFAGFGPAYSKSQNGENPAIITSHNSNFKGYEVQGNNLKLSYSLEGYLYSINIDVIYFINDDEPYIRKSIEVSDLSEGIHFLDKINVEDLEFDEANFSRGKFGQPVFNTDIFIGVEYPAVENKISNKHLTSGYVVGEKITKNKITSYPSVIGVSSSTEKLEQDFYSYVEKIKIKGSRPFLVYNTWYDMRNPAIAEGKESVMNEKNVLKRIKLFKERMYDKYKINLDAFVLDDGWDNYNSIWEIDTRHLPHKFSPFLKPLKEMNTSLGIWASPFSGYSNRNLRVNWGSSHGYEKVGDFLCFAGKNYKKRFEDKMVEYTKKYNLGYFKWDGFLLACNELNHGHLPGLYSRKELISTYIHMMNAVRKINPDIFINITVGTWLSPWWLKYADCIWMQGEDYAYAEDVPSTNPRDKAITYRDAVLWGNFQRDSLLFPMSGLMTHGIIKGRLNLLGGKDESIESFTNEVVMYFGRGVMMWELYISPDLLSDLEWAAIAKSLNWAKANKDVLTKTKMILGNPLKHEPYGYVHLSKEKGIIVLRNPYVESKQVELKLDSSIGELDSNKDYFVKVIYPYNKVLDEKFKYPGSLNINLNGYEIIVLELLPSEKLLTNTPIGVRYDTNENGEIILYDRSGSTINYKLFPGEEIQKILLDGISDSIQAKGVENYKYQKNNFTGSFVIRIPYNLINAKLAFLIEPEERLINESSPNLNVKVNGINTEYKLEQENGKWFWYIVPLQGGENAVDYGIDFKKDFKGKITLWIFGDEVLKAYRINSRLDLSKEVLLPKPYSSEINKITTKILELTKN